MLEEMERQKKEQEQEEERKKVKEEVCVFMKVHGSKGGLRVLESAHLHHSSSRTTENSFIGGQAGNLSYLSGTKGAG